MGVVPVAFPATYFALETSKNQADVYKLEY
jgi:hypothetical protein